MVSESLQSLTTCAESCPSFSPSPCLSDFIDGEMEAPEPGTRGSGSRGPMPSLCQLPEPPSSCSPSPHSQTERESAVFWGLKEQGADEVNTGSFLLGPGYLLMQAGSRRLMYKGGDPLQQGK